MKQFLLVALGGAIGSCARYAVQLLLASRLQGLFPWQTFFANVTGCLLIGVLTGYGLRSANLTPELRLFLITGICGGYTTFSTFSNENVALFLKGEYLAAFSYSFASIFFGFLATFAGLWLAKI